MAVTKQVPKELTEALTALNSVTDWLLLLRKAARQHSRDGLDSSFEDLRGLYDGAKAKEQELNDALGSLESYLYWAE